MEKEFSGKKRSNLEEAQVKAKEQSEKKDRKKEKKKDSDLKEEEIDEASDDNEVEEEFEDLLVKYKIKNYKTSSYIGLPHKAKYRMRAHCNPLNDLSISYPLCPNQVDWKMHYGLAIANSQDENIKVFNNTKVYPINYTAYPCTLPESTHSPASLPCVNILDIGCGFGGLLFTMSPYLKTGDLALGLEIRDKITNYCSDRIKVLRQNSEGEGASNISVVRTNAMKVILNYFKKGQIEKMFFCFADPHFKKYTHRRRVINKYLLQDYAYLLKEGGMIYSITDVEDLHNWHVQSLDANPSFERVKNEELEKDMYLGFMKNTDEARKVTRNKGSMWYAAWKRVIPKIASFQDFFKIVKEIKA
mmetsp:Transcript_41770/g.43773  ORF Transcript_41770/g.43773 Transcript_41770/m.43773 type:complete len:359 (-) Transcript_41770:117-1193(-)